MKTLCTIALIAAAAPAFAHQESAFASQAAHDLLHAHAIGGPIAYVVAGAALALALSPRLRAVATRGFARRPR